jgi:hypothetical protein
VKHLKWLSWIANAVIAGPKGLLFVCWERLDADLGLSGSQGNNRKDFRTLVADVSLEKVGAVFALEVSRLSRSCSDRHVC